MHCIHLLVNPRRACAARVTVVVSLLKRVFVLKMLAHNQRATKVKIFVGICLKRLRSRVMPRNMSEKANMLITRGQFSPLNTQRSVNGYPTIVNNIQPCQKRCLLMPLTRVRARTDSTTHHSYNASRGPHVILIFLPIILFLNATFFSQLFCRKAPIILI